MTTTDDEHECNGEHEYLNAITEILTIFDDDPQMTEELLAINPDQHTAESAALVKVREIGRRVMEGRGTASGTAEAHVREAERFAASADGQPDAYRRSVDLQAAQVHATLSQTLTAARLMPMMAKMADWVGSGEPAGPEPAAQGDPSGEPTS